MSNSQRSLDLPFFNKETELELQWLRNCAISEKSRTAAVAADPDANPPDQGTSHVFSAKLYVQAVTLSIIDNIKFLENIRQGFKKKFLGTNIGLK